MKLQTWLTEPHPQARVIGIYGMGGVGKTSVLKVIHNNYKEKVSGIFDIVIWFTVSKYKYEEEDDKIKELQVSTAHSLNLNFEGCPLLICGR
jgi:disease resistance protein RPS2